MPTENDLQGNYAYDGKVHCTYHIIKLQTVTIYDTFIWQ